MPTELPVPFLEVDEIPVQPGIEPRREAGGDVRREHARPEEHGVEALVAHELREHVHPRLRQRRLERRIVGDVDGRRTGGLGGGAADTRAGDDSADLAAELDGLGEHAERALRQLGATFPAA